MIPTFINLNEEAKKPLNQRMTYLDGLLLGSYDAVRLDQLETRVSNMPDSQFKIEITSRMQTRKKQLNKPIIEKELEKIRQTKKSLKNWKFTYILALIGILMLIANPATNKQITEEYQFNTEKKIGTITTELIIPSGWSWVWLGIIAFFIATISFCLFANCQVCGKLKESFHESTTSLKKKKLN